MDIAGVGDFFQFIKHVQVRGGKAWLSGLYGRPGMENLMVRYDKCLNKFGDYVEEYKTQASEDIHVLFLSPLTAILLKGRGRGKLTV
jgi:hypothetical protein